MNRMAVDEPLSESTCAALEAHRSDPDWAEVLRPIGPPVTETEIDEASRELGLYFPRAYRDFLLRFGGISVGGEHIHGLRRTEINPCLMIDITNHYRALSWPHAEQWIVVSEDVSGSPVGIAPDGRVLCSCEDKCYEIEEWGKSFEDFLRRWCMGLDKEGSRGKWTKWLSRLWSPRGNDR